jgi:UDP-N-acetylmuramoyl-tripeptide--D-alanyl-D-alanine ligase
MFSVKEIIEATHGKLIQGSQTQRVKGVSIDSRTIKPGEMFIAIKGDRFNAHNFIDDVRAKKAAVIVISDKRFVSQKKTSKKWKNTTLIKVHNTTDALAALAHWHRMKFNIPVVAITGSNGKTTTKEMIALLLSKRFKVLYNPGTQNNHIGVPLTLFKLRKKHSACVLEMGANHHGEIDRLSWIAKPTVAILTNIGPSHLEFFKTLKGVLRAKLELINNLDRDGCLILNKDDRFLFALGRNLFRTITFGIERVADYSASEIKQHQKNLSFVVNRKHSIKIPASGRHNVYNALASIACARHFGLSYQKINDAFSSYKSPPLRMQVIDAGGIKMIVDCYNSNPESSKCALDYMKEFECQGKKIAVFGDMLELGEKAKELHESVGEKAAQSNIDLLVSMGSLAKSIAQAAKNSGMSKTHVRMCKNWHEVVAFLKETAEPKDAVLIKGSRAMKMENIVQCFTGSSIH